MQSFQYLKFISNHFLYSIIRRLGDQKNLVIIEFTKMLLIILE